MASQRNPEGKPEGGTGARVGVKRKAGGTTKRPGIPVADGPAKARAVTMSGVGTEGGTPESGRARQDAANGTVHGQPRSGFKSRGTEAIPNRGS